MAADPLAFGCGAHPCIGRLLARLEVKVAMRACVNALAGIRCPPAQALQWKSHLVSRGLHSRPVMLVTR